MKKALKIILWLFGTFVVLAIVAAVVVPLFLDPNDFRDDIGAAVNKQTGRDLQIEGDLELSVIPWLGLRVGPARLSNAEGFGDEPMLAIKGASVSVKLMPLLSRQVEVSRVELDGLRLNLLRRKDGVSNWDDLAGPATAEETPPPAAGEQSFDIQEIAGVTLNDAVVVYEDRTIGEKYDLALGEFSTGRISGINTTPAVEGAELSNADVRYEGGDAGRFSVNLKSFSAGDIKGDADNLALRDIALNGATVDFEDPTVKLAATLGKLRTDSISGSAESPTISAILLEKADVSYDGGADGKLKAVIAKLESGEIALNPDAPEMAGLDLSGVRFNYNGGKSGKAKGTLERLETGRILADPESPVVESLAVSNAEVDYDAGADARYQALLSELTLGNLSGGSPAPVTLKASAVTGDPEINLALDLSAKAALNGTALTIDALAAELDVAGADVPGGSQKGTLKADRIAFDTESQVFSLKGLAAAIAGLDLSADLEGKQADAGPQASGQIAIGEFSPRKLMKTFGIEVPETADPAVLKKASLRSNIAFEGELLKVEDLAATLDDTSLKGRLDVTTGEKMVLNTTLNIDEIDLDRYLPPESEEEAPVESTGPTEIPAQDLKGRQVNATLKIGRVKVANLRMSDVVATANLKGGRLVVDPLSASLYDGRLAGKVTLATRRAAPELKLKQTMKGVDIAALMIDFAEVDRITGKANLDIDVTAVGSDSDQMIAALNGNVGFVVNKGALKGFNLTHALQQGVALFKGGSAPPKQSNDTEFTRLDGTAVIADGVMKNDDFKAVITGFKVTGGGEVDLAKETIDYEVVAAVQKGKKAQDAGLSAIEGENIPVRIRGSLDDPSIRPDLSGVIGDEVKGKVLDILGIDSDDDKKKKKNKKNGAEEESDGDDLKKKLEKLIGG